MGLSISIQPIAIFIIFYLLCNCAISFGKGKIMNLLYIILSSILSIIGVLGMILIRPIFISRLNKRAKIIELDSEFLTWAINKFDAYAIVSIIATCVILLFLLMFFIILKKRESFVWNHLTCIISLLMVSNVMIGIVYSLSTINKQFDVASYIMQLILAEIFALYIPFVTKRILLLKGKNEI